MSDQMPLHPADEERVATDMSRELETLAGHSPILVPAGFADRVMAAVATEPLPQPALAFGVALLGGRLRAAIASFGDAWRVTVGGSTPLAVRAQALALVLIVAIGSIALAGGAAVGAIDLLNGIQGPQPSPSVPLPSEPSPSVSPSPSMLPEPTPSSSPEGSPTDLSGETPEPPETPSATEHSGASSRPTSTGDHSGDGSGGGSGSGSGSGGGEHTPTPTPEGSDDHGGDSGSGEG